MTYPALLEELSSLADGGYRAFHGKLLADPTIRLFGVRVPLLRRLAKKYAGEWKSLLSFPDEWYEVTFLKCLVLAKQPYETFVEELPALLPRIDNWAVCDCFDAPCIRAHREDFLPHIAVFLRSGQEFTERYGLVCLLRYYMEEQYLPVVFGAAAGCDHTKYYVSMAAAWLVAETLVKFYGEGVAFLQSGALPAVTRCRAIRKARESFRLSAEQKEELAAIGGAWKEKDHGV